MTMLQEPPAATTTEAEAKPAPPGSPLHPARRAWLLERASRPIPGWLAVVMAGAWIATLTITFGVQPPPPEPLPPLTAVDVFLVSGLYLSVFAGLAGLSARRGWGLLASFGGGVVLLTAATLCFAAGHSGQWLATQFVVAAGFTGFSSAAFKSV